MAARRCGMTAPPLTPKVVEVPTGQQVQFIALVRDAARLEVEDAFFNTASAVFLPDVPGGVPNGLPVLVPFTNLEELARLTVSHDRFTTTFVVTPFDPETSGDQPTRENGLHVIIAALRFLERNPAHKLVIAGHTDRAGDDAFNTRLSAARGRSVQALLEGKKADFVAACHQFHAPDDDPIILHFAARTRGFDCEPANAAAATPAEIRGFQKSFNTAFKASIAVNGVVGDETRGAYFDLYEDDLRASAGGAEELKRLRAQLRFLDPAHKVLAFGERFPRENPGQDGLRSRQNRRVELHFFAPPRLPEVAAKDVGEQIFRKKLFSFAPLDRDSLAVAGVGDTVGDRPTAITMTTVATPTDIPAIQPLATEMPKAGFIDATDPWAFIEPFVTHHPNEGPIDPLAPPLVVG
jgi:hypothetical protein